MGKATAASDGNGTRTAFPLASVALKTPKIRPNCPERESGQKSPIRGLSSLRSNLVKPGQTQNGGLTQKTPESGPRRWSKIANSPAPNTGFESFFICIFHFAFIISTRRGCGGKPAGKNRMSSIASFDEFVPQLRAFMTRTQEPAVADGELDAEFNRLAAALFALQRDAVPIYGEFCAKRNVSAVRDWREIPALPAAAFKEYEVTSLPPAERTHVFHSSGTTRHTPSRHFHNGQSLAVYEASLRPWFRRHFLHPQSAIRNPRLLILTPPPAAAPHSSLAHMFATVRPDFGSSICTGRIDGEGAWALDLETTLAALREAQSAGQPVALLGTAFSFVHLLDHCRAGRTRCRLPAGSRALETGGYKGRGRAASRRGVAADDDALAGHSRIAYRGRIRHERIEFAGLRPRPARNGRGFPVSAVGARPNHLAGNRTGGGRGRNRHGPGG